MVGRSAPSSIPLGSHTSTAILTPSRMGMWSAWLRVRVLTGPAADAMPEGASLPDGVSASPQAVMNPIRAAASARPVAREPAARHHPAAMRPNPTAPPQPDHHHAIA